MGSIKVLNKISGPPAGNLSSHQVEKLHLGLSTEQLLPCPLSREEGGGGGVSAAVSDRQASGTQSASRLAAARRPKFHSLPEYRRVAPRGTKGFGSADKLITALRGHGKDIKRRRGKQRAGGGDGRRDGGRSRKGGVSRLCNVFVARRLLILGPFFGGGVVGGRWDLVLLDETLSAPLSTPMRAPFF